jgi:DNA primase
MNILKLYADYGIVSYTEGKNVSPGWVNTQCPHCDDQSNHLGFNPESQSYHCWRCGAHRTTDTLALLLHVSEREAYQVFLSYGGKTHRNRIISSPVQSKISVPEILKLPSNTEALAANHKRYLERRGFDPDRLEREWGLLGTGPIAKLDHIDFKHRIIAPIMWDGRQVSFQGRDITDKHTLKYITCPKDRELMFHKHILYGKQSEWKDTIIIVEGITDVWRFGTSSCGTFGIKYTHEQLRKIAKNFSRVAVIFDGNELQARVQADKIVGELRFRGVDAFRVDITGDPGSMKQSDADYLVKQLIKI